MHRIDLTLPSPTSNVAFDEALLNEAEQGRIGESLRIWNAELPFIVVGRGSKVAQEVNLPLADQDGVPVIRRITGGATILADSGCMFYAVLLSLEERPHLRMLDEAHDFVMSRIQKALVRLRGGIDLDGTCDLVIGDRKTSGNALRLARDWMLYHGTLLLDMNLDLVDKYLKHPPREPDYREGRRHTDFIANLQISREEAALELAREWNAQEPLTSSQVDSIRQVAEKLESEKYSQASWNRSR